MKLIPRVFLALLLFTLVISYQNFSSVESDRWDSAQTLKIINEMQTFDKNNPSPTTLATPSGGSDFESVRDNWMQKQSTLLLNGADKRLEKAMNDKLNSYLEDIKSMAASAPPPTSEVSYTETSDKSASPAGTQNTSEPEKKKMRQNLRFSRVNALKYEFGESSCVDFVADPGNTRFNYSQTLNLSTKMGLEHRSADNLTQMFLRYEW